jgi:hypothetical protein
MTGLAAGLFPHRRARAVRPVGGGGRERVRGLLAAVANVRARARSMSRMHILLGGLANDPSLWAVLSTLPQLRRLDDPHLELEKSTTLWA